MIYFTADWHIMDKKPVCRLDNNYRDTQIKKLEFISKIVKNDPLLHAGDVFDSARPNNSQELEMVLLGYAPNNMYVIPGNHDLPYHRFDKLHKSSLGVLFIAHKFNPLNYLQYGKTVIGGCDIYGFPYGTKMVHVDDIEPNQFNIAMTHQLVFKDEIPYGVNNATVALDLLKEFSEFDVILSGDNHKQFIVEHNGRFLINPGSLLRISADQIDHKPALFALNQGEIEVIPIPIEPDVVTREHIEEKEERRQRIDAYIEIMKKNGDPTIGVSFEEKVNNYLKNNTVRPGIKDKLLEAME